MRLLHPSRNIGGAGGRPSPSGAPPSTHATIVATCSSDRRRLFLNSPNCGSAGHGGMRRVCTIRLIDAAQGRASPYDSSDIGATSPGRWQATQRSNRIGAMSLLNVGARGRRSCALPPACENITAAIHTTRTPNVRLPTPEDAGPNSPRRNMLVLIARVETAI
jgi:hypothetical protein